MANKSPLLNVIIQSLNKVTRKFLRDFGEIENLQLSPNSINDFVNKAEYRINSSLIEDLTKARPDWKFKSNDNKNEIDRYYWIIDVLNGRINFSHGLPNFAMTISVEYNNEIVSTVIIDPLRDEIYFAEKGKGAFLNDRRIRVSKRIHLKSCIFSIQNNFGLSSNLNNTKYIKILEDLIIQNSLITREFGSSALNFAWLAAGKIDCFLSNHLSSFEVACGELLIREAGGYISNFKSIKPTQAPECEIIAANPFIHREILKKVQTISKKYKDLLQN